MDRTRGWHLAEMSLQLLERCGHTELLHKPKMYEEKV